ncbi:MAG: hypothetical protein IPH53_04405 [Flavobacteriales bacterium]|nr:hypothetical protein [Flavobacteriales bacterium]
MSRSNALYLCGLFWVMAQGAFGQGTGYVRVEGDRFRDENGDPFYPMVCNYFVHMPYEGTPDITNCRVVPGYGAFDGSDGWGGNGLDQAVERIENDFRHLKSMGFNAIRLMCIFRMEKDGPLIRLRTTQHIFPPHGSRRTMNSSPSTNRMPPTPEWSMCSTRRSWSWTRPHSRD